ncbi:MAG: phage tail protein [bacterium]
MASVIFSNAQRIIAQVFQWLQTSGQIKTSNVLTDTFSAGIDNATTSGEGFLVVPGSNNTSANPSINVTLGGIAYDSAGNRIFIASADTSLYNSANPTATTNDGLGNFLSTPKSTGVVNVPLTQFSQNYLWIDYLATIDTTAYTLNQETNAKIFYKQTDGYNIRVTTTNTAPDSTSVFLAAINMVSGGAVANSNISQVGRSYYNVLPNIVPITTPLANLSDRTPQYNPASTYTLEAHIKSVGTGPGISPFNPHNTSLADLGISTLDTVTGRSQIEGNDNVIIAGTVGNPYPTTSAMFCAVAANASPSAHILVRQLLVTEFAIVNGAAYSVTTIFGVVPIDASVFFPDLSGTYNVYWDSVLQTFGVTTSAIFADITKLWLCTATYTFVGHGPLDANTITNVIDRRDVGGVNIFMQRWTNVSRPTAPLVGVFGFNLTINSLEFWDGSAWQTPVTASSNTTVPTSSILPFAGSALPGGFLFCDGTSYLTTAFPNLFTAIGYTYGGGGGNFNVPDMRGNVPAGVGGPLGLSLGQAFGEVNHTLTINEMPTHSHTASSSSSSSSSVSDPTHRHASGSGGGFVNGGSGNGGVGQGVFQVQFNTFSAFAATGIGVSTSTSTSTSIGNNGSGAAHNNVQPSLGVNYIIKT